ncbi:CHAT domain-containing protein [Mycena crocata]|nr:CHAT domain-containing protein [Mycena crocata]
MVQVQQDNSEESELVDGVRAVDINRDGAAIATAIEEKLNQLPERHPQRCALLDALARTRVTVYLDQGDAEILDTAIGNYREALNLQPSDPVAYLSNIASCYLLRFRTQGQISDLENAIVHLMDGLRASEASHSARASIVGNTAAALSIWFQTSDLDDAIPHLRKFIQLQPDSSGFDTELCGIGNSLLRHFYVSQQTASLDEAIICYKQALRTLPDDDSSRTPCLNNLATALVRRFQISEDTADIHDAIVLSTQALALLNPSHPDRASVFDDLATSFRLRFEISGHVNDLDESFERQKEALALTPRDDPHHAARHSNLALCLLRRFQQSGTIADLEESITSYREVLDLQIGDPNRPISLNGLASALSGRFDISQSPPDLDEAITLCREAVLLSRSGSHGNQAMYLDNLTKTLRARFFLRNNEEDLQHTIEHQEKLLHLRPPGDVRRSSCLMQLGDDLCSRFALYNEMVDLDSAIASYREACSIGHDPMLCTEKLMDALLIRFRQSGAESDYGELAEHYTTQVSLPSITDNARILILVKLANILIHRFQRLEEMDDLEAAVFCSEKALELLPESDTARASRLTLLSTVLRLRFDKLGQNDDLERVIRCQREALQLSPSGIPHRATSLRCLAEALVLRFKRSHQVKDIDQALALYKESLLLSPQASERASCLLSLGRAFCDRFQRLGETVDIDEAVSLMREAALTSERSDELGVSFFYQFKASGQVQSLDESISHFRKALLHCEPGSSEHLHTLDHLVVSLGARFRYSSKMVYLEEAFVHANNALNLPMSTYAAVGNFAQCKMIRYDHLGQILDLQAAVAYYRRAHSLCPDSDPESVSILMDMAYSLVTLFRKSSSQMEDLEEGLGYFRTALELCDQGHEARPGCLSNLANGLRIRFHETGELADVNEAIAHYREALEICPAPERNMYLINFGTTLLSRFLIAGDESDVDEAIQYLQEAETSLPSNDPLHVLSLFNLGTASWHKYEVVSARTPDAGRTLLARAVTLLESAAHLPYASIKSRFEAALQWSLVSHSRLHPTTIQAYSCALDLLQKWVIVNPEIDVQQRFLATEQSRSLACDGAAAAIASGDLEAAVELLEHGRTILWSRLQGYRQSLDQLRLKDGGLAERFETLSKELEDLSLRAEEDNGPSPPYGSRMPESNLKTQRILSEQWDEVVSQIRQIQGFAHFLRPLPFSVLQQAGANGPVIVINVSRFRSDAIILLADRTPTLVSLPNATPTTILRLYSQLNTGLKARDGGSGATRELVAMLRALWTDVVQPVVVQLQATGVVRNSRVWWCPTSHLCGLPLHAAGSYSKTNPQPGLPDLFVSSYIPTLATLIRARAVAAASPANVNRAPEILVIGQNEGGLPAVGEEMQELQRLGPFVRMLRGAETTRANVARGLMECAWVHFACHAAQDPQPFQSSFVLNDGRITLLELVRTRRRNAELAFLSACNTATGDAETPDETLHLAAALQFSGFQSVVGTLWPMADCDGPDITREFYRRLFVNGQEVANARESAAALSIATKYLRRKGVPLDRWINFVHIGA